MSPNWCDTMDDYSALIVCWGGIALPTVIAFITFGPATVFDAIVEGFKTMLGGMI